jgi:hypothetical protein
MKRKGTIKSRKCIFLKNRSEGSY